MTIIDTTLYANGALRLSRHGAGKGGNVLRIEGALDGGEDEQFTISPDVLLGDLDRALVSDLNLRSLTVRMIYEDAKRRFGA